MSTTDAPTIVLASGNTGKLREFRHLLADYPVELRPQAAFSVPDIAETGLTFVENALLKARNACAHSGNAAIADDSGIEVDALQGAPGIYSARFAGAGASDADNNALLLERLRSVPERERTARFQCLLVYLRHSEDPTPVICQGTWEGRILSAPSGANGFGYDPLFWVPETGCSSAELDSSVKNTLSHRARAMQQLLQHLQQRPQLLPRAPAPAAADSDARR
ncbi:RdgB/HAM1 family non-canonical purine NTP pyrophosphatase [Exilibacterium tricleocarpae]|uniref:dITP/XTP pyrophosphatase n=1 Tax=Exilibacterium tricleocarpae TaxID=2591008 RepID=A0A545SXD2_9GAMM|nr:RdgB/HAM1 family non-canonical purine NTP pyrophosphatase [Exilibacterium tricleocarpae]TQV69620.1 RdgB/HAM1 family non-canonical purine NTP pyrophosphatase [Exilibacterium tricleocarpae]